MNRKKAVERCCVNPSYQYQEERITSKCDYSSQYYDMTVMSTLYLTGLEFFLCTFGSN